MKVAIVITDETIARTIREEVGRQSHEAAPFTDLAGALRAAPGLVFAEWVSGLELPTFLRGLRWAAEQDPPIPVVVLVPAGAVPFSQRARAAGAADVLFSPPNPAEVAAEIEDFGGTAGPLDAEERSRFQELLQTTLIGENPKFRRCLEALRRAARSNANVLLTGETGTGKEVFAKALHELSSRRANRLVAVNCAALPGTLLESELFGHGKGAFTGADRVRYGRFEVVGAGTLLLDEIGDIEPAVQMKLLRVVEQREFERLGENESVPFHARLVCATSVDLERAVAEGRFRRDLLGRINQFRIDLPLLRERRSDIPALARHFLQKHRQARAVELSASALEILESFHYPMNVRQLENAIIHALAESYPGTLILPRHFPREFSLGVREQADDSFSVVRLDRGLPYLEARAAVIRTVDALYLGELLRKHGGNQAAAAREADIDRKTFSERLNNANAVAGADDPQP